MAEDPAPNGTDGDVQMDGLGTIENSSPVDAQTDAHTPATTPGPSSAPAASSSNTLESNGASTSHTTPDNYSPNNDDDDKPPPAKRARKHSDADKASLAYVSSCFLVRRYGRANFACLPRRPSEVRNSTSSVNFFGVHQWYYTRAIIRPLHHQSLPIPLPAIHYSQPKKNERCWSFQFPRRSRRP